MIPYDISEVKFFIFSFYYPGNTIFRRKNKPKIRMGENNNNKKK